MTTMTETPINVAVVDDQALVRSGFAMLINSQPDLQVSAQLEDGMAACASNAVRNADVVLMDVRMPKLDGIAATQKILSGPGPHPKIIVLTTFDLDEYVLSAIEHGASGFLLKDTPPEQLLAAIRTVHQGDAVIAPSATRRLITKLGPQLTKKPEAHQEVNELINTLTAREREVYELIARGLSNQEIATELFLSEATVKTHVGRILSKLHARDRVQAVVMAYQSGIDLGVED
ncbi:response regulator [Micrococcoides hystricis]|uniref:Response regulator n=1 Tax=Micrococcoides hystricis TaxID=1572761 RepID=A0ABV6PC03_9MICC